MDGNGRNSEDASRPLEASDAKFVEELGFVLRCDRADRFDFDDDSSVHEKVGFVLQ
jgi:hypothetical protein